jgi:hypothetical protein
MFTINIGGAFIDFFDLSGMALFVEGPRQIYAGLGLPVWLSTFLADGIGGGAAGIRIHSSDRLCSCSCRFSKTPATWAAQRSSSTG